jgi:zinc transport system substrate-binding protein
MNVLHSFFYILLFCYSVTAQSTYIATIHPLQQIVKELLGQNAVVHDLLPAGASPHTYEPSPGDVNRIESAVLLFFVGPNLDDWVKKFPARATIKVIDLIPADSLIYFENFPAANHPAAVRPADESNQVHGHHRGIDPHFWTDPLLVKVLAVNLADSLAKLYPAQGQVIGENLQRFSAQLIELDFKIRESLKSFRGKTVVQAHPLFNYYLHRYGLKSGGVVEINPGVDPTARQIKKMIDQIQRENIAAIFTQPQLPDRAARLIAETTGVPIVELDPLGGKPMRQTYAEILLYNTKLVIGALQ